MYNVYQILTTWLVLSRGFWFFITRSLTKGIVRKVCNPSVQKRQGNLWQQTTLPNEVAFELKNLRSGVQNGNVPTIATNSEISQANQKSSKCSLARYLKDVYNYRVSSCISLWKPASSAPFSSL